MNFPSFCPFHLRMHIVLLTVCSVPLDGYPLPVATHTHHGAFLISTPQVLKQLEPLSTPLEQYGRQIGQFRAAAAAAERAAPNEVCAAKVVYSSSSSLAFHTMPMLLAHRG